jgi:membrane-bound lytic murein transglycosylase B
MKRMLATALVVLAAFALAAPRWDPQKKEAGRARVSLYRVAPGQQLAFLKWLAAREEVAKEAGIPAGQLYAHLDGDSWDYLLMAPITTPEQDAKFDEVAARKGVKTGFASALQFRDFLTFHSDTLVTGPVTAVELAEQAAK